MADRLVNLEMLHYLLNEKIEKQQIEIEELKDRIAAWSSPANILTESILNIESTIGIESNYRFAPNPQYRPEGG